MKDGNPDQVRVRLTIEGRVQGVFFRISTLEEAVRRGLKGWVRNCADGSVEVVVEGQRKKVEDMMQWCGHGPPGAHVHNVHIQWEEYKGEIENFRIKR